MYQIHELYFTSVDLCGKHSHLLVPGTIDRHSFPQVPSLLKLAENSRIIHVPAWEVIKLHWGQNMSLLILKDL